MNSFELPWNDVDAVFIDAGGVLLRPDYVRLQALCLPDIRLLEEDVDRALYVHGAIGAGLGPGDDDDAFVRRFAIAAGIPVETIHRKFDEIRDVVLFSPWIPRQLDICTASIRHLSRSGKLLAIVSNTENGGVEELLENLSICQVGPGFGASVEAIVDSGVIRVHKPDPEIYRYTARVLGVPIERCMHIGDSIRNDVVAAFTAGGIGVHFSPYETCSALCKYHLASLSDLSPEYSHD